jgi:hypothetical protein
MGILALMTYMLKLFAWLLVTDKKILDGDYLV